MPRIPYNRQRLQRQQRQALNRVTQMTVTYDCDAADIELRTPDEMPWLIRLQGEALPECNDDRTARLIEVIEQVLLNLRDNDE